MVAMERPGRAGLRSVAPGHPGQVWAIGGGKGGSGKTFLASNIAVMLARMGKEVILIDADLGCANLHTILGVVGSGPSLSDFIAGRVGSLKELVTPTQYARLSLISGAQDALESANPTHARKNALIKAVAALHADYIVLDLGAGTSYNTLDFFLMADKAILTVVPEPTSIENVYRFIKSVYFRRLKQSSGDFRVRELVEMGMDLRNDQGIRSPHDVIRKVREFDEAAAQRLLDNLNALRPKLVLSQVRTPTDLGMGPAICHAAEKYFGARLDYVGFIEYDDVVWQSVRAHRPVAAAYPDSGPARCVGHIVQNLVHGRQFGQSQAGLR